jgi:hypothetical protein
MSQTNQNNATAGGVYTIKCFDSNGVLKWEESSHNLVVNVGLQDMLNKYFLGSAYTAAWYLGLYGSGATNNPAASDTASSHAGWTEITGYSQTTRPAANLTTPTTANPSVITNTSSPAVFTINAGTTIGGAFLISNNTKGGTSGTLFSAADFSGGDKAVTAGDTLNLTYTLNLTAV